MKLLLSTPGSGAEFVSCSVRLSLEEEFGIFGVFSLNLWAPPRLKVWSFRQIEEQFRNTVWHFLLLLLYPTQTWEHFKHGHFNLFFIRSCYQLILLKERPGNTLTHFVLIYSEFSQFSTTKMSAQSFVHYSTSESRILSNNPQIQYLIHAVISSETGRTHTWSRTRSVTYKDILNYY